MSELPQYYTNVNPTLFEAIPKNSGRILEIGCGAGALGKKYIETVNPGCEYWGVEYVPAAASEARKNIKNVINGSIEDDAVIDRIPEDSFDVLIFGDVLEHLREPWDVLRKLSGKMRAGGICLACIPNTQHWSILMNLMNGSWEYQDSGLMDRTHLRFFTRKSMIDLFNNNGWQVTSQTPRIFSKEKAVRPVQEILETRRRLGIGLKDDEDDFLALQWVISAAVKPRLDEPVVPGEAQILINACIFAPNFLDVRTTLPANDLAKISGVEVLVGRKEIDLNKIKHFPGPKIVIVQRPKIADKAAWLAAVAAVRKVDAVLVYEVDDHPGLIGKVNGLNDNNIVLQKSACAIQTSTRLLAEYFSSTNGNVNYFRNSCHSLPIFTDREGKIGVFYGALNRGEYSHKIARLISPVIEKHGACLHVVADKSFFDAASVSNKKYYGPTDYGRYLSIMGECGIVLSPLGGLEGEKYKSDVKYIEASSRGLATIASELVYGDTIENGRNGLLVTLDEEWAQALDRLLSNPVERREMAFNAWDYVRRERLFTEQAPLRIQWYLDLWAQREILWAQVLERLPELRNHL